MGAIQDYLQGVAMRKNPALLQEYIRNKQAERMAGVAEQIYGSRGQDQQSEYQNIPVEGPMQPGQERGTMGVNQITQEATPGTGIFNNTIPERDRLMLMNKRMLGSGIEGFNKQWANNQSNMQNSMMQQLGAQNLQRNKQIHDMINPSATSAMKNLQAQGLVPGTPAYQQAMKAHMEKSGVTIKMPNTSKVVSSGDASKMVNPDGSKAQLGVNETYGQAANRGLTYGQPMTAEEAKSSASAEISIKMANDLLTMLDEGMDLSGFEGWAEGQRAGAGLTNIALDKALDTVGYTSAPTNVKGVAIAENLSNTVLQALRGAAVGPAEQERVDKQLPRPGQPKAVFKQNILLTVENLKMIQASKAKSRGGSTQEPEIIEWKDL